MTTKRRRNCRAQCKNWNDHRSVSLGNGAPHSGAAGGATGLIARAGVTTGSVTLLGVNAGPVVGIAVAAVSFA